MQNAALTGTWYDNGVAYLDAGTAFAGLSANHPLTTGSFFTNLHVSAGANGRLRAAPQQAPASITTTAPLQLSLKYQGGLASLLRATLSLAVPLGAGSSGGPAILTESRSTPFGGFKATLSMTGWHLGAVKATGLTVNGSPVPDVSTTGSSIYLTSATGADLGQVKLVTVAHIRTSGNISENTALPVSLTLTWQGPAAPVPEPGSGLLLAAGALGMLALARSKQRPRLLAGSRG